MINGSTEVLGIIGNPIKHTMSPDIHNTLSDELGINAVYVPFHVEDGVKSAVEGAYRLNIKGLNVTVPHKQDVIDCLAEIDDAAEKIGAVNTLVRTENGYKGYNTDMSGLKRACFSEGINLKDENIIILGAGGASRAVCYMCLSEGAKKVYLINRTRDKAVSLSDEMNKYFDCSVIIPIAKDEYKEIPSGKYLMFQCTSLGLHDSDEMLISDKNFYDMAKAGVDLIYNPAVTPFMKELIKRNIPVFNGLKMLLYQGIEAYELWNEIKISDELTERILTKLRKKLYGDNIILVGYMGSGKSTVGKALAEKLSMEFIDTDAVIEERENTSINSIFENSGEESFRNMETALLKEFVNKKYNTVISTGGGMVLRSENISLMKKLGRVIYLKADAEEIYERVKSDTKRPLLKGDDCNEIKNRISDMIFRRTPYYETASDLTVDVTKKDVDAILEVIFNFILARK